MSNDKIKSGTGYSIHSIDRENKTIRIDFSGNPDSNDPIFDINDGCLRNDASILFFVANSYKSAFLCLGKEIENRFDKNKEIEHLILPYLFNFRHYVELMLKALYVTLTGESPKITHSLNELVSNINDKLTNLDYCEIDKGQGIFFISEKKFKDAKDECLETVEKLKNLIAEYSKDEPVVEYYRYIFENERSNGDKYLVLNNPVIQLDYPKTNQLFCSIRDLFVSLCIKLRDIIYIYFTL